MIDPRKAQEILASVSLPLRKEELPLSECLGRYLVEDRMAETHHPPFDKATMDGYAYKAGPGTTELDIVGEGAAGDFQKKVLKPGECLGIMTGAMMPQGADSVVRLEYTGRLGDQLRIKKAEFGSNVVKLGENTPKGAMLLPKGRLNPASLGILASDGAGEAEVYVPPQTALLATGNELMIPGEAVKPGRIYDANTNLLEGLIHDASGQVILKRRLPDDPGVLQSALDQAASRADLIIFTGGVSMGQYDYLPSILEEAGAEILFHKVAVKPGKPLLAATYKGKVVFGLPGNPVSALTSFVIFIRPLIERSLGGKARPKEVQLPLAEGVSRRDAERWEYRPALIRDNKVEPLFYTGSTHLSALARAEGVFLIPKETEELPKGSRVLFRYY